MTEGERDLVTLLARMDATRRPGTFVFCSRPEGEAFPGLSPLGLFREEEGVTLIVRQEEAEARGWDFRFPSACLTLRVHSSLDAVGFLAAVAGTLAGAGISCNVVSAWRHDHLFVPLDRADEALAELRALQEKAGAAQLDEGA